VDAAGPSWDALRDRVASGGRFSSAGAAALKQAIGSLEQLLGPSWPRRQYERYGWWPGELNLLGFHVATLPQFLALVIRLENGADEPTFSTVLRTLKRGVTSDGWRHALLQLEVGRALRDPGTSITFEPKISGSANRADLLITRPDSSSFMVETTTLARAKTDLEREQHEQHVWQAVTAVELRHGVRIAVHMTDYLDDAETSGWLGAIEHAASSHGTDEPQLVESAVGRAEIRRAGAPGPGRRFIGTASDRDGWHRLGRAVHAKARQSVGPLPVWLRIDALDGFFQFTEWTELDWTERIKRVATALRHDLADAAAGHLAGVVLSSSSAVSLGATDLVAENQTAHSEQGTGIRRLVSAHVVRETVVIVLRDDAMTEGERWAAAYSAESTWLLEDLSNRAFPQLDAIVAG
jgi:hypothetical protein